MGATVEWILADAHVHFHSCYQWRRFLEAATVNLASARLEGPGASSPKRILAFTESEADHVFDSLLDRAASGPSGGAIAGSGPWRVRSTNEEISVVVEREDGTDSMWLLSGYQIAAAEDLEVLLLGSRDRLPDGLPIREVLERTRGTTQVRVVPWGAGKWWFSRGRLLADLVEEFGQDGLFLGDGAGRPWFWPRPDHFDRAFDRGVRDLPGSDPLPFPYDVDKVGRRGVALQAPWDGMAPGLSFLRAVRDPDVELHPFGAQETTLKFFRSQIKMQLRKRRRTRA
jgi:hypothetical protein